MSHSELAARRLYDTMQLGSVSEDVKRHLIILMLTDTSSEDHSESDIETMAKNLAIDEEHMQEMKSHSYYRHEAPEQLAFVSEDSEMTYYDSMSEDAFLSEEESANIMTAWRNLQ